jgi:hypothetical protein
MIINNEQMNSMEVYPCQLKDLYLSCYGCCRNGVISSSNIKDDLKNNKDDFKKYYLNKEKIDENLKNFRDRDTNTETLSSGVCRNLVDFGSGYATCLLHPFINSIVDKSRIIALSSDLRFGFCDTKFECNTVKFWSTMNLSQRKEFIRFLELKKINNHTYSMTNINGELIREFLGEKMSLLLMTIKVF